MLSMRVQYDASGPIIFASDFPVFRDNLKAYLEQETDIEIIGCASSEQEVIRLLQSSEPKLVVLDLKLEWEALCALLHQIHTTCSVRSLVMADGLDSSRVTQSWSQLLRRVFDIDVSVCERCGGPVRVLAAIQEPETAEKILNYFGLPAKPPPTAPARYQHRSFPDYL